MPATPRYILRYPDPSDPAGFNAVGQPVHLRSLAEETETAIGAVDDGLTTHSTDGGVHGGPHPDLPAHDTLGLATDAELSAHAATLHGGVHPDLPAHDTLGLATQTELDAHALTAHGGSPAADSITTAMLQDLAVTVAKIATNAVTGAKLAVDAVTVTKIANGAVTAAKVAADVATQAELDQAPVMRVATANGVFAVASGTSIYTVPNSTWALPDVTAEPDGTIVYRAA